jgi:glyoxylase-like metal-dependent hydrolase (beta-lactamase superfamily II)
MNMMKKFFKQQSFMDVTGYNCGVSFSGPPLMTAWCYVVGGVLIDTGTRHLRDHILAALSADKPEKILITHHHEDHSGNAGPLKERLNIPVYGHPLAALKLRTPFKIMPYQHLVWGKSDPVVVEPCRDLIEAGPFRFRPIHTPGHSEDHTVYLEETKGMLFSGDLFLGERIKFFRADESFEDQLTSIRHVLTFDFEHLFCAHRPTMDKGKDSLSRKLEFLLEFYGKVKDLRDKGWKTGAIIRKLDRKNDRTVKWITLNNACFAHMVRSAVKLADKDTGRS